MKKFSVAVVAGAVILTLAGCAQNNQTRRDEQYAQTGDQMIYNIGVVEAEQQRIKIEAEAKVKADAAADKAKREAQARADRARRQANDKIAAEKRARQQKLNAYADRERELEIRLRELDVEAREAEVKNIVSTETERALRAKEKVQLELDALRAQIRAEAAHDIK